MPRPFVLAVVALFVLLAPLAHARHADTRLVFYLEVTGADAALVRAKLRSIIPPDVVVVDADEFRSALAAAGQTEKVGKTFGVAAERDALYERLRTAGRRVHADGIVVVLLFDSPKVRVARVIGIFGEGDSPTLNQLVALEPAKLDTDLAKMKEVLGPTLEEFAHPPKTQSAQQVWQVAEAAPAIKSLREPDPSARSEEEIEAERNAPRVGASLRAFLFGGSANFLRLSSVIPVSKPIAILPTLGGGQIPKPVNDQAYVLGAGVRVRLGDRWALEPGFEHLRFPKIVASYQGRLTVRAALGQGPGGDAVEIAFTTSASRMLWERDKGPRGSELFVSYTHADVAIRPVRRLTVTPSGGVFVFDRGLSGGTSEVNAVAFALAPFPVQAWFGAAAGVQLGRWMPYVYGRQWIYAAGIGSGTSFSPLAVRMTAGADFVDASLGLFINGSHGPLGVEDQNLVPIANIDVGWAL